MALLIDQLAAYLATSGEGTVGTDIFKIYRPPTPGPCVTLYATGGYTPNPYTKAEFATIQVVARATTPDGALRKCYSIFNKLHGLQQTDLGSGVYALGVEAEASPVSIGTEMAGPAASSAEHYLASVNFAIHLRQPSS